MVESPEAYSPWVYPYYNAFFCVRQGIEREKRTILFFFLWKIYAFYTKLSSLEYDVIERENRRTLRFLRLHTPAAKHRRYLWLVAIRVIWPFGFLSLCSFSALKTGFSALTFSVAADCPSLSRCCSAFIKTEHLPRFWRLNAAANATITAVAVSNHFSPIFFLVVSLYCFHGKRVGFADPFF